VDHALYHKTIVELEKKKVNADYIQGWIGGFMGNPKREEQRVTDAYDQGFEDGENQDTSKHENWIAS
jgi:ribosomal protein S2